MKKVPQIALGLSGAIWLLSWIGMALEIFYWHHVTPSLRLNPPPQLPGLPSPRPGGFLITVIVSSIAAPLVCLALALAVWLRKRPARS
jgi:hypothetical protein